MRRLTIREAAPADLPTIVALLADDVNASRRESIAEPLDLGYAAAIGGMRSAGSIAMVPGRCFDCAQRERVSMI